MGKMSDIADRLEEMQIAAEPPPTTPGGWL